MSLNDRAIADFKKISGNTNDFGIAISIKPNATSTAIIVNGWFTKHHLAFTEFGDRINSKLASVAISEGWLTDANYVVRNSSNEVDMLKHLVSFVDSSGISSDYIVRECYPDEKLGIIVLILSDYE